MELSTMIEAEMIEEEIRVYRGLWHWPFWLVREKDTSGKRYFSLNLRVPRTQKEDGTLVIYMRRFMTVRLFTVTW
jgi:hypothetical protein